MNKKIITTRKIKSVSKSRSVLKNKKKIHPLKKAVVDTHFALAIVFLLASGLALYAWIGFYGEETEFAFINKVAMGKNRKHAIENTVSETNCKPHYYDGEAKVQGWKSDKQVGAGIVVQIDPADVSKLPTNDMISDQSKINLVGASAEVQNNLNTASPAKPATITIKGYATTCDSNIPVASLESATEAFKKS
jgi:hypothetical protein